MLKKNFICSFLILLVFFLLLGCSSNRDPSSSKEESKPSTTISSPTSNGTNKYEKYLSIDDVGDITAIENLAVKEESLTLSFYSNDETVVLEAKFYDASFYEEEVGKNQDYYTAIDGIGDKAAICIPGMPYRITFLKGSNCIMLQTIPKDGSLPINEEHLMELAKIIASRLE